ncbi:MAG: AraC family transcriptional regulator [Clostridiaceae bacterium]
MLRLAAARKRSVIFAWIVSYVIILIIPISFAILIYMQASRLLEHEINQSNSFLLKRVQQYMDSLLADVESLNYEIMFNPDLQVLRQHRGPLSDTQQYAVYQIVNAFRLYKGSNSSIDQFFIYFPGIDLIISDNTSTDSRSFYHSYYSEGKMTYQEWLDFIKRDFGGEYMSLPVGGSDSSDNPGGNMIAFARSLSVTNGNKNGTVVNLFILLDESRFLKDAEGIDFTSKGNVFIINRKNRIIASTSSAEDAMTIQHESLRDENGLSYAEFSGEKVIVSFKKSLYNDWKYVSVIPVSVFMEKLEYIRRLTYCSLFFCLLLAGLITYTCIKKNYKPLDDLLALFKNSKDLQFDRRYNEYSFIRQAIHKTMDENSKINYKLMEQNKGLRSLFLARLLKGKEGNGVHVNDLLSTYNIHFGSNFFAVIVFYINNIDGVFEESRELDPSQRIKLIQFIMTNVIEELIGRKNTGYMSEVDEMMVCLLNLDEQRKPVWKDDITSVVSEAQKFIRENYHFEFTVAASDVHETLIGIPLAYSEALQVMEYKKVMARDDLMFYDSMGVQPKADYYYPLEKEYQLINCIKAGDLNGAGVLLDDIFDKNFGKYTPSIEIVRCLMFNMVSTMLKTMNDIRNNCRYDFLEELKPVDALMQCSTIGQMKRKMLDIIKNVCEYLKEYTQNTDFSIRDKVIEFVDKNYDDMNLGNSVIAEALDLNPDYVSAAFKRQTGEGLLDYINTVRIKKAKRALKECPYNIDEIAGKVGYNNTRTFTRLFKKYEGITPGKFREVVK